MGRRRAGSGPQRPWPRAAGPGGLGGRQLSGRVRGRAPAALLLPHAGRAPRLLAGSRGKFLWPGGCRREGAGGGRRPDLWPARVRRAHAGARGRRPGRSGPSLRLRPLAPEDSPAERVCCWGPTPTRTRGDASALALALAGEGAASPAAHLTPQP